MGTTRVTAALVASLLIASPALAQPRPPTDAQKQQAGDLVKKAIAKSQAGDHPGSIDLYLQAYAIVPLPVLLSNIGAEFQQSSKPVEALKYFCKYLEADPTGSSAAYAAAQAKVLQVELNNKVDDANVCAPAPAVVETTPDPVLVTPPPAPAPRANPGRTLELAGMAVGGVGVLSLGLGFYFGSEASSISDQISNHNPADPWPDNINDLEKQGESHETKQIIFLTVGGVALVGGAALYFLGRSKRSSEVSITPTVAAGGAGVVFSGAF